MGKPGAQTHSSVVGWCRISLFSEGKNSLQGGLKKKEEKKNRRVNTKF